MHLCPAAGIQSPDAEKYKNLDVDRLLARLLQHGHITIASVQPILGALKTAEAHKESKSLVRLIYFLVQLALGDGTAGTPLPMPFSKGACVVHLHCITSHELCPWSFMT